jgi:hypothetical protein
MKVVIETNQGVFSGYLNSDGKIVVYAGDDDTPVTSLTPNVKRAAVLDVSTDGVAKVLRVWLENEYDRLEIERVIAHLTPPGR